MVIAFSFASFCSLAGSCPRVKGEADELGHETDDAVAVGSAASR
jgi:hypothetical protein